MIPALLQTTPKTEPLLDCFTCKPASEESVPLALDTYQHSSNNDPQVAYAGSTHQHPPEHAHEDLIAWNWFEDRVRVRGNVWGETWGKAIFNQPIVQTDQSDVQNVYEGTIGVLSEFRIESDYQISWLKGVPFLENILAGVRRIDHFGVHATADNVNDGVRFELVGTFTNTWPDIPLASPVEGGITPALSISLYSTGHRHADERDVFLPQAHGSSGLLIYEKFTGIFGQIGGEHTDNLPWESAVSARLGWMMPLDRVYHNFGWDGLRSTLGGGPHDHGPTQTALPNSSDDLWERSKIAFYYEWKSYDDPIHPDFDALQKQFQDFNASHINAKEQSFSAILEHRFNDEPAESPLAKALFSNARLLLGAEYKSLQIEGEKDHIANLSTSWFAPSLAYEKSIPSDGRTTLNFRAYAVRDRIAGKEENDSMHFKPVTTVGFRVSISASV